MATKLTAYRLFFRKSCLGSMVIEAHSDQEAERVARSFLDSTNDHSAINWDETIIEFDSLDDIEDEIERPEGG